MKFQFFRFYALIILAGTLLVWSFNQIYNAIQDDNLNYQIEVDYFFDGLSEGNKIGSKPLPNLLTIEASSLALPPDIQQMVEQGKVIAITDDTDQTFYYKKDLKSGQLMQFGPFMHQKKATSFEPYVVPLFYSSLAFLILLMMRPIFRDLYKLQQDAVDFGLKPSPMKRSVKESSNIYPLARAFYTMSDKVLNFIQMNKDLSRTISHEIRTPLARMKFMLELISPNIKTSQKERIQNDISEIESLVNDYLSFAKVENETDTLHFEVLSIKDFLKEIYEKFSIYEEQTVIHCHSDDVQVCFDKSSMSIAIQNLLTNAIRFSDKQISLHFSTIDNMCVLSVEDDGPGVGDNAQQLMQPFSRENVKEQNHKGFGLGLYIVRKVAIWHEGEFNISKSDSLGGAKMVIRWPNNLPHS